MRTRVKICGLTRAEDVEAAVRAGADALGFVLWPGSRRGLDLDALATLAARVPPFVTRVGLFVDQDAETIAACLPFLDMLQFHGNEPPEECQGYGRPWMKALRMHGDIDLHAEAERYRHAQGLLLDAFKPGVPGGTGETFDWSRIPADLARPVILAGGLTPDNVGAAIARVRPFAVDVSGGVEATTGVKDHAKIETFIRNAFARGATGDHADPSR